MFKALLEMLASKKAISALAGVFTTTQDYNDSAKVMTARPTVVVPDLLSKEAGSG